MDTIQELYNIHSGSEEAEDALRKANKEMCDYVESNMPSDEKAVFADTIDSIIKSREVYYFESGFKIAVKLLRV